MPVFFFLVPPLAIWLYWYRRIVSVSRFASSDRDRIVVYVMPVISALALLVLLFGGMAMTGEIWELVANPRFDLGLSFVGAGACATPLLGLSPIQDVAERRNHGAGWAIGGGIMGLSLAYGTAASPLPNVQGDFFFTFVGILGITFFMLAWLVVESLSGFAEAITVERDGGAALRLAGFLPLLGVTVGLAVSSWIANQSVQASCLSAAIAGEFVACCVIEASSAKRPVNGPRMRDVLVALAYLGIACLEILLLW